MLSGRGGLASYSKVLKTVFMLQSSEDYIQTETFSNFDNLGGGVNLRQGFLFDGNTWKETKTTMSEDRLSPACSLVQMDDDEVIFHY